VGGVDSKTCFIEQGAQPLQPFFSDNGWVIYTIDGNKLSDCISFAAI
jgi:hypothetical protein